MRKFSPVFEMGKRFIYHNFWFQKLHLLRTTAWFLWPFPSPSSLLSLSYPSNLVTRLLDLAFLFFWKCVIIWSGKREATTGQNMISSSIWSSSSLLAIPGIEFACPRPNQDICRALFHFHRPAAGPGQPAVVVPCTMHSLHRNLNF